MVKEANDGFLQEQDELKQYIEMNIYKKAVKLKGKFPAFSELIQKESKILSVLSVHQLPDLLKNLYLIRVKNYSKSPKERYFLAVAIASQSSDLLVNLLKDFASNNSIKLAQYSLFPKLNRISLIGLREIKNNKDFNDSIKLLKQFKIEYKLMLKKLKNLIQNK